MRLKYVIGGALLSLAIMAASGTADAVLIDENPPGGTGPNIGDLGNPVGGVPPGVAFPTPAPEPATLALLASGLISLGLIRRRRKA